MLVKIVNIEIVGCFLLELFSLKQALQASCMMLIGSNVLENDTAL